MKHPLLRVFDAISAIGSLIFIGIPEETRVKGDVLKIIINLVGKWIQTGL